MNAMLWVLQCLLALHTIAGAMWKLFFPEQTVPSLRAMPHGLWLVLIGVEVLCAIGLILPAFNKRLAAAVPIAAAAIAAEMLLFCAYHLSAGSTQQSELIYWLVVAAAAAFIAYGRMVLRPLAVSMKAA
jgi:hypothetical protein